MNRMIKASVLAVSLLPAKAIAGTPPTADCQLSDLKPWLNWLLDPYEPLYLPPIPIPVPFDGTATALPDGETQTPKSLATLRQSVETQEGTETVVKSSDKKSPVSTKKDELTPFENLFR